MSTSRVIDGTGAKPRSDISVQLLGDRIGEIAKHIKAPAGVQVINAKGKFLIPGLWDMHVHLGYPEQYFALLVANGITGIREMYTGLPLRSCWRCAAGRTFRGSRSPPFLTDR